MLKYIITCEIMDLDTIEYDLSEAIIHIDLATFLSEKTAKNYIPNITYEELNGIDLFCKINKECVDRDTYDPDKDIREIVWDNNRYSCLIFLLKLEQEVNR